jgi:hypothetical protein
VLDALDTENCQVLRDLYQYAVNNNYSIASIISAFPDEIALSSMFSHWNADLVSAFALWYGHLDVSTVPPCLYLSFFRFGPAWHDGARKKICASLGITSALIYPVIATIALLDTLVDEMQTVGTSKSGSWRAVVNTIIYFKLPIPAGLVFTLQEETTFRTVSVSNQRVSELAFVFFCFQFPFALLFAHRLIELAFNVYSVFVVFV